MDNLTYAGNLNNLKDFWDDPNLSFEKLDINNYNDMVNLFDELEINRVVHFAAETHVDTSIRSPNTFFKTNVMGTQNILECCRKQGIECFIQVSTDEVYGSLAGIQEPPFKEPNCLKPNNPYSASKAAADLLVRAYKKTYDLPAIITRCSNDYGPRQFPEKLIPVVILNALNNKPIPLYGDGSNIRDWIYVEDHCRALTAVLNRGKHGEIYNFGGGGEEKSNLEIIEMILNIMDKPRNLIKFVEDRKGHDFRYSMDFSKASKDLGWNPIISLHEGLTRTVNWYLDNQEWVKHIKTKQYKTSYQEYLDHVK